MFFAPSVITSRRDRLSRDEKDEYDRCLSVLSRAGSITPFGCLYVIERVGDPAYYKAGKTSLDNLHNRRRICRRETLFRNVSYRSVCSTVGRSPE
jgi:hypothetical protein